MNVVRQSALAGETHLTDSKQVIQRLIVVLGEKLLTSQDDHTDHRKEAGENGGAPSEYGPTSYPF